MTAPLRVACIRGTRLRCRIRSKVVKTIATNFAGLSSWATQARRLTCSRQPCHEPRGATPRPPLLVALPIGELETAPSTILVSLVEVISRFCLKTLRRATRWPLIVVSIKDHLIVLQGAAPMGQASNKIRPSSQW